MSITIAFDTINDLNDYIANAINGATFDLVPNAPAAPITRPSTDSTGRSTIDSDNVDDLDAGDQVSWKGAKFSFDGTVESVTDDIDPDAKVVFIRRNDTGRLVSLTNADLDNYLLRKIAA